MRSCHHCGSQTYIKNGSCKGVQRYVCKSCGRSFSSNGLRIPLETKRQALEMYVNSVGIRKIDRFVKSQRVAVWTAYSRQEQCVIAFVIGKGLAAAKQLYALVKAQRARIETIYTDANSCYQVAFAQ